ncbi:MAG: hypothetical protein MUQ65_13735, partial [Armatimonadetes bacterium]|nr:hypothetical protein [Armatimonadota bacterium]
MRAQPDGVFTLRVAGLEVMSDDTWLENHYPRIGQKLTPANIGTGKVKDISREGQQITVRTLVEHAADCERQAERIELLLSNLYAEVKRVDAETWEVRSSDLDE